MRLSAIVTVVALMLLAWGLALRSQDRTEYTTSSSEAFALYQQGNEQFHAFQFHEAEESLRRALELDPAFAMAEATLAVVLRGTEGTEPDWRVARAESLAARLEDPNERMLVQLRLAKFGLGTCRVDSLLSRLDESRPRHPIVLGAHALVAMNRGEGDRAERIWRELLREDPNHARAYNWLGYNAAGMGRYDEALSFLRKYAYLAPDLANPHDSLGEILSYLGRYEEAEAEFRLALERQPDFFVSLINLARIYVEQGRLDKGLALIEQLRGQIEGTPWEKNVDNLMIQVFYAHDLRAPLADAAARYVARHPDDRAAGYYRAYLHLARGEYAAATAACDSFLAAARAEQSRFDEQTSELNLARLEHSFAANLARERGDHARAAASWEQVLASSRPLAPHHQIGIRVRYAEALLALDRRDEALAQADAILGINPRMLPALALRLEALLDLERMPEARTALVRLEEAMAAADPDFPLVSRAERLAARLADRLGS